MFARVVQLQKRGFDERMVQSAVNALRDGALVVLPTETVYGIAVRADDPNVVEHLIAAKNRSEKNPFTLAFPGLDRISAYIPRMSVVAERLARRLFPGPITLVLNADFPESEIYKIPKSVRRYIMPEDSVGVRVPKHEFTLEVLRAADFPIALTSANLHGQIDCTSAMEVVKAIGDKVDLIFDDGDSVLKRASSVLVFARNSSVFRVAREGFISKSQLERFAQPLFLFVCSGNTCRSPMAEVIARDILAKERRIRPENLEQETGVHFLSAGLSANDFSSANPMARKVVKAMGLSLASHISHPVTPKLLEYADRIFCMTPPQTRQLLSIMPEISYKVFTLAQKSGGISDPFGGSIEAYETCAHKIREELEKEFASADFRRIAFSE